jgi:hypothetical protein
LYWTSVSRPGYVPGVFGGDASQRLDLRKATFARRDFELVPRRRVTGRVQDEKARPIDGALVTLGVQGLGTLYGSLDRFGPAGPGETAARSAPDGTFVLTLPEDVATRFGGLRTQVVAVKPGHAAGVAALPSGHAAGPVVLKLVRGLRLSGRVLSREGTPLAGVAIAVGETGLTSVSERLSLEQDAPEWSQSDAAGRFAIQVHPVLHQVAFRKEGYAPRVVEGFDPRRGEELSVVLERGAEIRGQVLRHDGKGVAAASVSLLDALDKPVASTFSAAEGDFLLGDLTPGPYEVLVTTESGIAVRRTVEAPASDVRIEIGPTTTVRGRVVEAATRSPVARFHVTIEREAGEAAPSEDFGARSQEFAVADGGFVIEDVPLGESTLTVRADGYLPQRIEDLALTAEAPPPEIEVALDAGLALRGRVTSTEGAALGEAYVSARTGTEHEVTVTTDENGQYAFKSLAPGEVTLEFRKPGFRTAQRRVPLPALTGIDVTLSRGLALRGVVVAGDASVANAQVHATSSAQGADVQGTVTDQAGHFILQGLVPGRYDVTASSPEHGTAQLHDVDVATAGRLRLVLDRSPTAILNGTVVGLGNDDGGRAPVVTVQVQSEEGFPGQSGVADVSGAFRIDDAPAGRVRVMGQAQYADGSTRSSSSRELTLLAGSESATVVEFRDDLVISGTVIRAAQGLPGATVTFQDGTGTVSASKTDRDGRYQVGLVPGAYSVEVSASGGLPYQTRYVAVESATFDIDVTGGVLRGRVVEAGSTAPLADASVTVWPVGGAETSPTSTLQSSAQGTFEAGSLGDGHYRVVATKKGFGQQEREVELGAGGRAEVLFELEPADGVSVAVVDGRDNRPLDAIVVVRDLSRRIVANRHVGADGEGSVTIPLTDGPYLLSVSAHNYGTVTRPVTSPARGLRIGLTPGGTLRIESPRSLRGRIRLVHQGGEEYVPCCGGSADTLLEGRRTTVEHITPGLYTLQILEAAEGAAPRPVAIREGAVSTVTIE